jgi:hypothetical protein
VVEDKIVLELKARSEIYPVHEIQLLTFLSQVLHHLVTGLIVTIRSRTLTDCHMSAGRPRHIHRAVLVSQVVCLGLRLRVDGMTLLYAGVTLACHCGTFRIVDLKLRIADLKFRIVDIDLRHGGRSVRSTIQRVLTSSRRFELARRSGNRRFEAANHRFEVSNHRFEVLNRRFEVWNRRFEISNRRYKACRRPAAAPCKSCNSRNDKQIRHMRSDDRCVGSRLHL